MCYWTANSWAATGGDSTPFFVDLSAHMNGGRGHLMTHVENRRQPDRVSCHHCDWFNYGGIYRDVALYVLPERHICDAWIKWSPSAGVRVDVETAGDGPVTVEIPALEFTGDIMVSGGVGRAAFDLAPEQWSPDRPVLYDVVLRFGDDEVRERIGFREVRVEGSEVLVNGEPVLLRGINVHEDDRDAGRVATDADIARRFDHAADPGRCPEPDGGAGPARPEPRQRAVLGTGE